MTAPSQPAVAQPPAAVDEARYSRWRTAVLIGVHVLFGIHVAHWLIATRTLAPLELNEVMYTFELGIVTAGFLLMTLAALSVLVFGRYFCSWACHVLALQDLSAWFLDKIGIRPKPVRSRLLRVTPFVAVFYMFVWPQIDRLLRGETAPQLHVAAGDDAWASFVTDDFWRNLPGPWIATGTFLICGFLIVYLLGSRAFCANACPYGAVFNLLDRIAPGRILEKGECTGCGRCTAVCQSGVWVHEEIARHGKIVDPNCLRDLDCVAACPEQALGFGFARPPLWSKAQAPPRPRPHHLSWSEDLLAATALIAALLVFRGLYGVIPFLMSLGIGCCLAWIAVLTARLLGGRHAAIRGRALRKGGAFTPTGRVFAVAALLLAGVTFHSAVLRYHEFTGDRAFERSRAAVERRDVAGIREAVPRAIADFEFCERWGLLVPTDLHRRLASLHAIGPTPQRARPHLEYVVTENPDDLEARLRLCKLELSDGHAEVAARLLGALDADLATRATDPRLPPIQGEVAKAHARLAEQFAELGDDAAAAFHRARAETR